jgi:nucleotide-binding universal stress UspA family protein
MIAVARALRSPSGRRGSDWRDRGATGLKRLLLGSVAEGTLVHSPGPVLVVK